MADRPFLFRWPAKVRDLAASPRFKDALFVQRRRHWQSPYGMVYGMVEVAEQYAKMGYYLARGLVAFR